MLYALQDCRHEDVSIADITKNYNIPFRTLWNKMKGHHTKSVGGQTALSAKVEEELVNHLLVCSDYAMSLEKRDVKLIVHQHLWNRGQTVSNFKVVGDDWVSSFIKRYEVLSHRMCQNIKRARVGVNPDEVKKYFDNLNTSLEGVPVDNILNYDETYLTDEPGMKKCLFRRGVKYSERVMNYSKGNISVMFAGSAEGEMLPPCAMEGQKGQESVGAKVGGWTVKTLKIGS
ncbi:hypothetical protein ElyMa_003061200 [Elysia marginata]|uniref:HTH CENPB-type domain-containing protein n=1 Tax=Elysia marginata TaxID=1093978 RepID=A0AAV4IEK7_9GAST|nr:hypothetical protein ElyMa_003061200 [Elysia marginata]